MRSIVEAIRNAIASIRWTLKSVLRGGVWALERVAEVVPAAVSAVGNVVTAPLRALAALKPAPKRGNVSEAPTVTKESDQVEDANPVQEPTPIPTAILVRRAARAKAAGEPYVGLVPEKLGEWFERLPADAVRALAQAAVADIRGRLDGQAGILDEVPVPVALPTKEQRAAMLDRLRLDLAAGRVVTPTLNETPPPGKKWMRDHLPHLRPTPGAPAPK